MSGEAFLTCKDCLRALNPYLDRELSEDDVQQVKMHLEDCLPCLHLFRFEETVRRLVRVRCLEQQAPEGLRTRIEARLIQERIRIERRTPRRIDDA